MINPYIVFCVCLLMMESECVWALGEVSSKFSVSYRASELSLRAFSSRRSSLIQTFVESFVYFEVPIHLYSWFRDCHMRDSYLKGLSIGNVWWLSGSVLSQCLAQNCVTHIFALNSSILHWAVHDSIAFSQLWSLMGTRNHPSRTMASFATPFSLLVRMCPNHLAASLLKIAELSVTVYMETKKEELAQSSIHQYLGVWTVALVSDSSTNTASMYQGSLWGQTFLLWDRGQTSAQSCNCWCYKNKSKKNIKNVTLCMDSETAISRETG